MSPMNFAYSQNLKNKVSRFQGNTVRKEGHRWGAILLGMINSASQGHHVPSMPASLDRVVKNRIFHHPAKRG